MSNEDWVVSLIDEHRNMINEVINDFGHATRLLDHGVLNYEDYRKTVLSNAEILIKYLKAERRPATHD